MSIFADFIAKEDSTLVKRLKDQGAVILGTTNMMESGVSKKEVQISLFLIILAPSCHFILKIQFMVKH